MGGLSHRAAEKAVLLLGAWGILSWGKGPEQGKT